MSEPKSPPPRETIPVVCEHKYVSDGVRYRAGNKLPASDAREVEYFDSYACEKCLDCRVKSIGVHSNTYGAILFGARPLRGRT